METKIVKTTDYASLKTMPGNRPLNEVHVRRLMESFKEEYLFTVLYLNELNQVTDGQHRLEAAKRLGLPVWTVKVKNYGLKEVQKYNELNERWKMKEYLDSFASLGEESYVRLKEFMENNKDFGLIASIAICTNTYGKAKTEMKVNGKRLIKAYPFKRGELKITDLGLAYENAGKIREYSEFFDGYNKARFVQTMIGLFKNKKFKHETMIRKLRLQPKSLVQCRNIEQYTRLLEDIYNFKNQSKLNFRF